jgi:hypothetical protein
MEANNQALDLLRQLIGIAHRPVLSDHSTLQAVCAVDLVQGLSDKRGRTFAQYLEEGTTLEAALRIADLMNSKITSQTLTK